MGESGCTLKPRPRVAAVCAADVRTRTHKKRGTDRDNPKYPRCSSPCATRLEVGAKHKARHRQRRALLRYAKLSMIHEAKKKGASVLASWAWENTTSHPPTHRAQHRDSSPSGKDSHKSEIVWRKNATLAVSSSRPEHTPTILTLEKKTPVHSPWASLPFPRVVSPISPRLTHARTHRAQHKAHHSSAHARAHPRALQSTTQNISHSTAPSKSHGTAQSTSHSTPQKTPGHNPEHTRALCRAHPSTPQSTPERTTEHTRAPREHHSTPQSTPQHTTERMRTP